MAIVNSRRIANISADEINLLRDDIQSNVQDALDEVLDTLDEFKAKSVQEIFVLSDQIIEDRALTLDRPPATAHDVYLVVQNASPQVYGLDFITIGDKISWKNLGLQDVLEAGDTVSVIYPIANKVIEERKIQETRTLSENDIFNKRLDLQHVPNVPHELRLIPVGGGPQVFGLDFDVEGNVLSWSEKGLEPILAPGDTLFLTYPTFSEEQA